MPQVEQLRQRGRRWVLRRGGQVQGSAARLYLRHALWGLLAWSLGALWGGWSAGPIAAAQAAAPAAAASVAPAQPLRLGAVPLASAEETVRQFTPLVRHLTDLLGRPVVFQHHEGHSQVLQALRAGDLDLAFLGPAPYIEVVGTGPGQLPPQQLQAVVRFKEANGRAQYRCVLAAFADDPQRLDARERWTVGMPSELSTCGPLSARALMAQAGVPWARVTPRYLGEHDRVARAAVAGQVQLAAVREEVAERHAVLGLRVLTRTEPLPGFVLVARTQRLSPADVQRLARLPHTPATEVVAWGGLLSHGMEPASDADFDALRALQRSGAKRTASP